MARFPGGMATHDAALHSLLSRAPRIRIAGCFPVISCDTNPRPTMHGTRVLPAAGMALTMFRQLIRNVGAHAIALRHRQV